jgi:hypothetical protein
MSEPVLPQIHELNRPFWDACSAGKLVVQRCDVCGHLRYPISAVCPRCMAPEFSWQQCRGRGEVYSFVVFRHVYHEAWRERVPYVVALIRLDEGPTMLSNVVDIDPESVRVGLRVNVAFERATDKVTVMLPVFTTSTSQTE